MARTSWVPPRNKKGIRDLQLGLSWMRPGPKCCPLCSTEEPNGFVFLTAPPPPHLYPNVKAALWRQGGGQLHKPMPVCRSTGMHLVSSGFSGWLFVLAGGHTQFLPNWNTFSGRAGPTILILVEAKVSLFIKLPFVIFIEQNDNLSNGLHSVFQQERVFLPPTRVCDLLMSSIVQ